MIALLCFFLAYVFDRYLYHANKERVILGGKFHKQSESTRCSCDVQTMRSYITHSDTKMTAAWPGPFLRGCLRLAAGVTQHETTGRITTALDKERAEMIRNLPGPHGNYLRGESAARSRFGWLSRVSGRGSVREREEEDMRQSLL